MKKYINRSLENSLKVAIKQFPVVLITGPRQSGKSTLLQHFLQNYLYISFDDILIRDLAKTDPELFLKTYPPPVILDEIQYVPELFPYLKRAVDISRRKYGQYILTGSQIFPLMQGVSESLAGRIMIFELFPLNWGEIPNAQIFDEKIVLNQIIRGFYPEFQVQPKLKPEFWHSSYLTTYIERDLRMMRKVHDLGLFKRFLVLLAARAGQLLNLSEVGKECGISQSTAKDWLQLLQSTSIIYLLESYARNMTKRIIKSPKLYFVDTGVLCYLLRIETTEQLTFSPFAAHIFENMVVMEKVKSFAGQGKRAPCYFYRTSNGMEIDLLIDYGSFLNAFEIKFTLKPTKQMIKSLTQFKKEHSVNKAGILTLKKETLPLSVEISSFHWAVKV